jgi:hypothetical protein
MTDKEQIEQRAAFEAFAQKNYMDLQRADGGQLHYISHVTRNAWLAWQSAIAARTTPVSPTQPSELSKQLRVWGTTRAMAAHYADLMTRAADEIDRLNAASLAGTQYDKAEEILSLHRQLAAERLRADQGWERYESANADRNALRAASVGAQAAGDAQEQIDAAIRHLKKFNLSKNDAHVGAAFICLTQIRAETIVHSRTSKEAAPAGVDADAMTRLRRVLGLLDIAAPFPEDDTKLHEAMFSLLGMVARNIETLKATIAHKEAVIQELSFAPAGVDRDAADCLQTLVNLYVMNQGTAYEYISCITPKHAVSMTARERATSECWSAWDRACAVLAALKSRPTPERSDVPAAPDVGALQREIQHWKNVAHAAAQAVPEGFMLVPKRATPEMLFAALGWRETDPRDGLAREFDMFDRIYHSMVAATPAAVPDERGEKGGA